MNDDGNDLSDDGQVKSSCSLEVNPTLSLYYLVHIEQLYSVLILLLDCYFFFLFRGVVVPSFSPHITLL